MSALLLVALCLVAGAVARPFLEPAALSGYVLYVALPALAVGKLHHLGSVPWLGVACVWLVFGVAWGAYALAGRAFGLSRATVACLVLLTGLCNTSFLGFPLLEALVGPEAIPLALPLDQLGSFLLTCTLAPLVVAHARGAGFDLRAPLGAILRFPGFWAMLLGLALRGVAVPEAIDGALDRIGATLSPVALVAVGAQLAWPRAGDARLVAVGLGYKLLLAPALVLGVLSLAGQPHDASFRVTLLECAMAPMVTGAMLAVRAELRPDLAQTLLAVGMPLSLVTVWAWAQLG